MSSALRVRYLEFLNVHGLQPTPVPVDAIAIQRATAAGIIRALRRKGEKAFARAILQTQLLKSETVSRHPVEIALEKSEERVTNAIRGSKFYGSKFTQKAYVGEFPIGELNARVVEADEGYLILINRGLLNLIQQSWNCLFQMRPEEDLKSARNRKQIDEFCSIMASYIRFGDSLFGPRPLVTGIESLFVSALSRKTVDFVVAHEFAHVVAGHFSEDSSALEKLATPAGELMAFRKQRAQELEADAIAFTTILGVDSYSEVDFSIIDRILAGETSESDDFRQGTDLKAAIAAPIMFLMLDSVTQAVINRALKRQSDYQRSTHPEAKVRIAALFGPFAHMKGIYTGFAMLPLLVMTVLDGVAGRILEEVQLDSGSPNDFAITFK